MVDPWLVIIGIGEDGLAGLSDASRAAMLRAEIVFGGARHLELAGVGDKGRAWPLPFSVDPVLDCRGRRVAVLASGDPFWHGVGGVLADRLTPADWISHPAPSVMSLAANRLGWRLEDVVCLGLHAAPFGRLVPLLAPGRRFIVTLRDAQAAAELASWLVAREFGASDLWLLERLGGRSERVRSCKAAAFAPSALQSPVCMAIEAWGGAGLSQASGLPDDLFFTDGQITKRPIRALTLSALAPRAGELLWDIGAGSGSISVEWCLAGGRAVAIEPRAERAANIRANADAFGVAHRLRVVEGHASEAVQGLDQPAAVFIGGGADMALLDLLWALLPAGTRVVANAVTLETETLLVACKTRHGGDLWRYDVARATPLGRMSGWTAARPVTQWSVTR